jgi:Leucine-rich repeat (LRR) protein
LLRSFNSVALNGNRIDIYPETALKDFPKLRVLSYAQNKLTTWTNKTLEILIEKQEQTNQVNKEMEVDVVPLFTCPNLEYLDFSDNSLPILPTNGWKNFTKLVELRLHLNKIEFLPEEIGLCTSLQELDVSVNKLKALPSSITTLMDLKLLDVHGNLLDSLPETLNELKSLRALYVEKNPRLENFPQSFCQMNTEVLTKVNMDKTTFLALTPNNMKFCEQLQEFNAY